MGGSQQKSRDTAAARAARSKGAPGGRRGEAEEAKMQDAVEHLMLHRASRHGISVALAPQFGRPVGTPIPLPTVDAYIARVKDRWAEEAEPTRAEARARQLRRLYRRLASLRAGGHHREAVETEKLIAKIEGNEAPKQIVATTPPGKPIEVTVSDPRKMTHGARQRRIAELQARNAAAVAAGAAIATAVGATPGEVATEATPGTPAVEG